MAPTTRSHSNKADADEQPPTGFHNEPSVELRQRRPPRAKGAKPLKTNAQLDSSQRDGKSDVPPKYTIDLSRPPAERYTELALEYQDQIRDLTGLFNEVVESLGPKVSVKTVERFARLSLRRLNDKEQTEELRGISAATGVEMYLLVAFNTLLDLFMGCTSGGVKVRYGDDVKMLHFRTLDWGMDALRKVVVQLEFVDKLHGEVIARSVTYVGFVGVLTGVRKDLSVSLNFRPTHNASSSILSNLRFYGNHLLVLLGLRPSIASNLRGYVIPPARKGRLTGSPQPLPSVASIVSTLPSRPSTAAYIIISDGTTSTVFEKDRATSTVRSSSSFIIATNHDLAHESQTAKHKRGQHADPGIQDLVGISDLITESIDRKGCVQRKWRRAVRNFLRADPQAGEEDVTVTHAEVVKWLQAYPVLNECTHYAVIMDPRDGEIVWTRRWKEYEAVEGEEVRYVDEIH